MDEPIYDYKGPGQMGLSPLAALEWFWDFARTQPENRNLLACFQIKVEKTRWGNVPQVTIRWSQASDSKRRQSEKVWKVLQQDHEWVLGRGSEFQFQPFANGLAGLLLESGRVPTTTGDIDDDRAMRAELLRQTEAAQYDPNQKLLVVPNLALEGAASLFWELPYFATKPRAARAETTKGVYQLYWVMSDPARGGNLSSFQPTSTSSDGYHVLDCYVCEGTGTPEEHRWLVFGPADRILQREALRLFCAIVTSAPEVFGQPRADAEILAALLTGPENVPGTRADFLNLSRLRFFEEWELVPRHVELRSFEVLNLEASASEVERLGQKIEEARPRMGYELQLRRSAYTSKNDREIERLRLLQRKISDRLADLQGFRPDRPTLLRFTPQQLPILGDILRYYEPKVLNKIRYSFSHTSLYGAGLHFLYLEPGVRSLADLDPLSWWGPYGDNTMHFWLDPAWARSYDASNNAEVFVPYGWTLYPPLHSWRPDEMDGYLEQTVSRLADEKQVEAAIPERPIYLFDGQGLPEEKVHLSVLDRASFVPLQTKLGWLNSNLLLIEDLGLESFVLDMADLVSRRRLAERMLASASKAENEFRETAEAVRARWAEVAASMLTQIEMELNRIISESQLCLQDAQRLNQHLAEINTLNSALQRLAQEVDRVATAMDRQAEVVQKRYGSLARKVQATMTQVHNSHGEYERRVHAMIESLERTHAQLKSKLSELRRLGSEPRSWNL